MKETTRVLMIAATPFFSDRGCHIRIYEEMKALRETGIDVKLCAYHIGSDVPGISVERNLDVPWYKKVGPGASWGKLWVDPLLFFKSLAVFYRFRPDVIHAHLTEGLFIAFLVRLFSFSSVPIVFDSQGVLAEEMDAYHLKSLPKPFRAIFKSFFVLIERILLLVPDQIVCSSRASFEIYIKKYGVKREKAHILSDGFSAFHESLSKMNMDSDKRLLRERFRIPSGNKVILYTGALVSGKGVREYLDCIPRLVESMPHVSFAFLGYGDLESEYKEKYKYYIAEGRVVFMGRVSYFELQSHASIADYAIDPKQKTSESSAKILNYLSFHIPTFCFNSPISELRDSLVMIKSFDDIAPYIESGQKPLPVSREAVEDYSWKNIIKDLVSIYAVSKERGSKRLAAHVIVAVIITILFAFLYKKYSSTALMFSLIRGIDLKLFAYSFCIYALVYILRGYRFSVISSMKGLTDNVIVSVIHTFAANILPASLGELAYPFLLKSIHGVSYSKSLGDLGLVRVIDFVNVVLIGLSLLLVVVYKQSVLAGVLFLVVCFIAMPPILFFFIRRIHMYLKARGEAVASRRPLFDRIFSFIESVFRGQSLQTLQKLFHLEISSVAVSLSMLLYGFVLMKSLGLDLSPGLVFLGLCVSIIGGGIPLDGFFSFGITEVSLSAVLVYAGLGTPLAAALAVSHHLATLLFSSVLFVCAYLYQLSRTKALTKSSE